MFPCITIYLHRVCQVSRSALHGVLDQVRELVSLNNLPMLVTARNLKNVQIDFDLHSVGMLGRAEHLWLLLGSEGKETTNSAWGPDEFCLIKT